jgi:uncharacterized membrane protein
MWNDSFVLADRIKGTLLVWIAVLVAAATAADVAGYADQAILPLTLLGVVAQTFIIVAALKAGVESANPRPNFARVLGIALTSGIAILFGSLLLVLPGLLLLIRWWVAVPVALDRDIGVVEALRESWALTADRWIPIAGLLLGLVALFAIPFAILFMTGDFDEDVTSFGPSLLLNIVTYAVTNFGTVSTVAVYRAISGQGEDLRAVFE